MCSGIVQVYQALRSSKPRLPITRRAVSVAHPHNRPRRKVCCVHVLSCLRQTHELPDVGSSGKVARNFCSTLLRAKLARMRPRQWQMGHISALQSHCGKRSQDQDFSWPWVDRKTANVRILITASIQKGTCSQDKRGRPTNMCARPFFFIRRCLEVEARRCRRKDIACPFPVSAPLCGASSYAPTSGPLFRAFAKHLYAPAAMGRRADAGDSLHWCGQKSCGRKRKRACGLLSNADVLPRLS